MKYLKHFNESINIAEICEKYKITNWDLVDGKVNVDSTVNLSYLSIAEYFAELPLDFGEVTGDFFCSNILKTLVGAPYRVNGKFYCSNNKLTSLEYAPKYVGLDFHCSNNKLTSLEYAPKYVGKSYYCQKNQLTSLEYVCDEINGVFNCSDNKIESLNFLPKYVKTLALLGDNNIYDVIDIPYKFLILNNPSYIIYKYLTNTHNLLNVSIDYFNDCRILVGKDIYIDRFKAFLDSYSLNSDVNVELLEKVGYTIK